MSRLFGTDGVRGVANVDLTSELLLFDDVDKNFDFEKIFSMMTTGLHIRQKYKNK